MKASWLALVVALGMMCPAVQAQENVEIIDVLPAVDPGIEPDAPFLSCNFLIGVQTRPHWWGRSFLDTRLCEQGIKAQLEILENAQIAKGLPVSAHISRPQWNESLGLYILHARFYPKGQKWSSGSHFIINGELTPQFTKQTITLQIPFSLSFTAPKKRSFPRATLLSPQPQMWVRSVRVATKEDFGGQHATPSFPYEVRITIAGRRIEKREEMRSLPEIIGEDGANLSFVGEYGLTGGLRQDKKTANLLLANSEIEFVTYSVQFDQKILDSAASIWVRQLLRLGGRAPVSLTFPLKREGKLLTGEVAPRDWKILRPKN